MRTKMVYDLPTRIFHWCFACLFLFAFIVAKNIDDESIVFAFHMLAGLLLGILVIWRIYWGFSGSEHAQFSDFSLNPKDLISYSIGIFTRAKRRWPGHNPASSWSTVLMLLLASGLAISGILMGSGYKEEVEDSHELMANLFLIIVIFHIVGIIVHSWQHKDNIGFSMLDGRKELSENVGSDQNTRIPAAFVLLALIAITATYLVLNFDPSTSTLSIFGKTLIFGKME
jgi:cytochrome b